MNQPPPTPNQATPPHQAYPQAPRKSRFGLILGLILVGGGLLVLAFLCLIVFSVFSAMKDAGSLATNAPNRPRATTLVQGGSAKIAHIDLEGVISASTQRAGESMVDDFSRKLNAAVENRQVKAIVIRINSPGGEVTASDRLHHMIQEADAAKPVIAYMDTIAASGGYYAACGTRHLMAHPTTCTGSIGVIMQSMKYADLLDKVGLSTEVYKSGKMKDMLSGTRETSEEEAELVNELIQETYDRFLQVVAENRNKEPQELRSSPYTDGRIFSGQQGLEAGFIDSNGFISDAYAKAAELAGIAGPTVITYRSRPNLFDLFDPLATTQSATNKLEIDVSERILPQLQPGVPLYLHRQ